jgi:hypothetical protein
VWVARTQAENARHIVDRIEEQARKSYEIAMQDTYGGETPQETLRLYIEAVEKGDYVLASKYFIGDYQEKALEALQKMEVDTIAIFMTKLKSAMAEGGNYSQDNKEFYGNSKLLIRLKIYPNGIWKIIEI